MTTPVWINLILAVPFVLAIVGIPLWMTWQHADTAPDFSPAREYLAAKNVTTTAPAMLRTIRPRTRRDLLAISPDQSAGRSELALSRR